MDNNEGERMNHIKLSDDELAIAKDWHKVERQ